jgi:hypothetical protein
MLRRPGPATAGGEQRQGDEGYEPAERGHEEFIAIGPSDLSRGVPFPLIRQAAS